MPNDASIAALLAEIQQRRSFFITSHARPDGDAIGTAVGLMHLLEALGKHATVAFADPIPTIYRCLPGVERIVHQLPSKAPDAAIVLECDSVARTGFDPISFVCVGFPLTINIDHHLSGRGFADFNWIDPSACAVGSMVYELILASGTTLTEEMATCLYAAILTDTGSFTHSTTVASTFGLAQHLLQCGADANAVTQAIYFSNSPSKVRLLGAALCNLQIDGQVAWASITEAQMNRAGAVVEDCEGVINYLIGIAGIQAAAFLREVPGARAVSQLRLSLRSKGAIDVAEVAERFGGGGHRNSSGCTLEGPLALATERIVNALQAACPSGRGSLLAAAYPSGRATLLA